MYARLVKVVLYLIAIPLLLVLSLAAGVLLINLPTIIRTHGLLSTVFVSIGVLVVLPILAYFSLSGIDAIELLFEKDDNL